MAQRPMRWRTATSCGEGTRPASVLVKTAIKAMKSEERAMSRVPLRDDIGTSYFQTEGVSPSLTALARLGV